jgi:DNA gyrase subunit A
MADLDKETVDMRPNFDDTLEEPTVMPTRVPNLLVNGAAGIAVGMATNMPPHNLTEVCNGIVAYIEQGHRRGGLDGAHQRPDFPTGGIIYGTAWRREAYETGRGRVVLRAKCHIEEDQDRVARPSSVPRSRTRPTRPCSSYKGVATW